MLCILWLIFAFVYAAYPVKSFRVVDVAVLIALVLRHLSQRNKDMETQ